jgi:hypothetical protein
MNLKSYCGYCDDRKATDVMCPVVTYGSDHLHTECRACKFNLFDFNTTLKVIRKKTSDIDPVYSGIYPKFDEVFFKYRSLEL